MDSREHKAQNVFGKRARFYTTSTSHTDEQVLSRVVEMVQPERHWEALDVATGTGHTAFAVAPHVRWVVATDVTAEMLREAAALRSAKTISNIAFQLADVHHLPFADRTFDVVTCRRAAHHFSDIHRALAEIRRVMRPGAKLVIDDRSVPEDDFVDTYMNLLDTYHDESHVREYRGSEWEQMLEHAGFTIEVVEPYTKHRPLTALTDDVSEENAGKIRATLANFTEEQRRIFSLVEKDGQYYHNHWFVMLAGTAK